MPSSRVVSAVELEDDQNDPLVLFPEVVVQDAVDDGVEAAVEVRHEVTGCEEPLRYGLAQPGIQRHAQPDHVQRRPADGEEHKHHEHGEEVAQVVRFDLGPRIRLDPPPHLDDQDPDAQVAVGDDADGQDEVHHHHRDGVQGADRLRKGARVHPWVVLQRLHEPVGHDGEDGEQPDQHDIAHGVAVGEEFVVLEAVADVAVTVDGDAGDVEDGANDTQAHEEAADLAVDVAGDPAVVENGGQDQGVGIDGDYQVGKSQAHHEGVSCREETDKPRAVEHEEKRLCSSYSQDDMFNAARTKWSLSAATLQHVYCLMRSDNF